jgi:hypothetical protein
MAALNPVDPGRLATGDFVILSTMRALAGLGRRIAATLVKMMRANCRKKMSQEKPANFGQQN